MKTPRSTFLAIIVGRCGDVIFSRRTAFAASSKGDDLMATAENFSAHGSFEASLPSWRAALDEFTLEKDEDRPAQGGAWPCGRACRNSAKPDSRFPRSKTPTSSRRKGGDKRLQIRVESSLGTLYMFDTNRAGRRRGPADQEPRPCARQIGDNHLTASALNNLGNLHAYEKK